jgi:hypothetical protein
LTNDRSIFRTSTERLEVGQRRVTCPEVVHAEQDPGPEVLQDRIVLAASFIRTLCHLELEVLGAQVGVLRGGDRSTRSR